MSGLWVIGRLSNSKAPKIRKRLEVDIYVSLLRCC
ncbi:hypothetical protein FOCG_06130 [Fusarium oxysporum f. sp. radicis-lycopersici 26381]|uniref:Uncharacterized protein n=1 Tax=Fusarium oxysporum Fo47 TaxID=660027 RepID=W9JZV4_FUSOX|nr:hypothetical protein FOZG_11797 [Fusarium oxysporum Fo47]EWZ95978.1 hypothetical protein FOWG_03490 [Fusarium oxysporum f. sp. lycopersici MN25]EXL55560.1 hypothetical protein FOCG_06130 [Fusarium oxysporum f. sp. radicis-lycopersici 26381]